MWNTVGLWATMIFMVTGALKAGYAISQEEFEWPGLLAVIDFVLAICFMFASYTPR